MVGRDEGITKGAESGRGNSDPDLVHGSDSARTGGAIDIERDLRATPEGRNETGRRVPSPKVSYCDVRHPTRAVEWADVT